MNKSIIHLILFILIAAIVSAAPTATMTLSATSAIKQGQIGNFHIDIASSQAFNGTINIDFSAMMTNISGNQIDVLQSDFDSSNHTTYDLMISGNTIGIAAIYANLTSNNTLLDQKQMNVQITDGIAPTITSVSPSGSLGSQSVTLSANTNENAECRYSTLDRTYDLMENTLGSGISTSHQSTITLGDGSYTIYARCNDTNGNTMQNSAAISFSILTTASAQIKLNKESPLTAGIVEVTVITSKSMADVTLSYAYSDAPTVVNIIPLAGSGTMWNGYFIIPETSVTRIGTFTFMGTDSDGITGMKITDGKLFIVDTSRPKEITDIVASAETGRIKLKWFYDGETGKFNIYRSVSSDVSYVDLYESTNESFFSDRNVNPDRIYYYRIAAMTSSGNVGTLSSIVNAQAEKYTTYYPYYDNETGITYANPSPAPVVAPAPEIKKESSMYVLRKIDEMIKEISTLLIDVEKSQKDMSATDDPIEKSAIADLNLIDSITAEKGNLAEIKSSYESYRNSYIDETEFNRTNEFMGVKIKKSKLSIPKKIMVLDKSTFIQETTHEDILSASNTILNESQVKDSLAENKKLNDNVKIEVDYKVAELTYLDDSKEIKTIVRKSASYQSAEPAKKIMLVETIPKTIALSADDIIFNTKYLKIIKKDPVVGLELDELNFNPVKITYALTGKKEIEEIKKTKTVAITTNVQGNRLTGMSIFSIEGKITMFDWIILAGVVLLIGLTGYYFMFVREQPISIDRKEMHGLLPQDNPKHQNENRNYGTNPNYTNTSAGEYPGNFKNSDELLLTQNKILNLPAKTDVRGKNIAKIDNLRRVVNEGHFHIDNLNYSTAQQLYMRAIQMSESMNTSMPERSEVDTTIFSLYNKLLLMSKINEAHASLDRNDKVSAMTLLDEISMLNGDIARRNSNTELAEYSLGWQNKLQKRLFGR